MIFRSLFLLRGGGHIGLFMVARGSEGERDTFLTREMAAAEPDITMKKTETHEKRSETKLMAMLQS